MAFTSGKGGGGLRVRRPGMKAMVSSRFSPYASVSDDWRSLERELANFMDTSCWQRHISQLDLSDLQRRLKRRMFFEDYEGNMYAKVDFEDAAFCGMLSRIIEHRFASTRVLRLDNNGITDISEVAAALVALRQRSPRIAIKSLTCLGKSFPPKGIAALNDLGLETIAVPLPDPDALEELDESVLNEIPLLRTAMAPDGYMVGMGGASGGGGTGVPIRACSREDAVEFVMMKWLKQILPTLTLINHAPAPAIPAQYATEDAAGEAAAAELGAPPSSSALLPLDLGSMLRKPPPTFPPVGGDFSFEGPVDRGMLSITITRLYDVLDRDHVDALAGVGVGGSVLSSTDDTRIRNQIHEHVLYSFTASPPPQEKMVFFDDKARAWWGACRGMARQLRLATTNFMALGGGGGRGSGSDMIGGEEPMVCSRKDSTTSDGVEVGQDYLASSSQVVWSGEDGGALPYGSAGGDEAGAPTAVVSPCRAVMGRHADPMIREGSPALPIDKELSMANQQQQPSFNDCVTAAAQVLIGGAEVGVAGGCAGRHADDNVGVRKVRKGSPVLQPEDAPGRVPVPKEALMMPSAPTARLHLHTGPAALLTAYKRLMLPTQSHYLARAIRTVDAVGLGGGVVSVMVHGTLHLKHGVHSMRVRFHDSVMLDKDMRMTNLASHFYH